MGAAAVRVTRVLDYRPDQGGGFADLSATLMINRADLPATQLVQPGSRVSRAMLFAGRARRRSMNFASGSSAGKARGERVQSIADASPQIRASADRAGRFLSLASLVSVLLAAIAVAMAAQRYARRHLDTVALMKCMGASQRFVLAQTVLQLRGHRAASRPCIGTAIGYVAQSGIAWLLRDLLRGDLPPPSADAFVLGIVTAVVVLVGFALPPLLRLKRVPPARVLRRDLEPPPLRYGVVYGLAIGAVLALLYWIVRDPKLVGYVAGGLAPRSCCWRWPAGCWSGRSRRCAAASAWPGATGSPTSRAAAATASCRSSPSASASWCCCCWRWCATTCCATGSAACPPMRPTIS